MSTVMMMMMWMMITIILINPASSGEVRTFQFCLNVFLLMCSGLILLCRTAYFGGRPAAIRTISAQQFLQLFRLCLVT